MRNATNMSGAALSLLIDALALVDHPACAILSSRMRESFSRTLTTTEAAPLAEIFYHCRVGAERLAAANQTYVTKQGRHLLEAIHYSILVLIVDTAFQPHGRALYDAVMAHTAALEAAKPTALLQLEETNPIDPKETKHEH